MERGIPTDNNRKTFFSAPRRALRNPRDPGAERPWREATGREPVVSRPGLAVVNRVLNDQGAFYRKSALVRHYRPGGVAGGLGGNK